MGFFKKIINSTYNFKAYNVFFKQSVGKGIFYLFLLCLCLGTISNIFIAFSVNTNMNKMISEMKSDFPEFSLANGKLNVDGDMPITLKEKDMLIIIDTENDVDTSVLDDYSQGMILTADKITQKQKTGQILSAKWKDMGNITFSKSSLLPILSTLKIIVIAFVFIFFPLFSFLFKLAFDSFVIMGLGGLIICAILRKNLKYSECAKLGMYAITVPCLLDYRFEYWLLLDSVLWNSITLSIFSY